MRETFRPWLRPTDAEFDALWGTCVFTFDTNVLLNLYRYSEQASSDLLSVIDTVSHRAWLPHQVGLEFYRTRLATVRAVKASYTNLLAQFRKRKGELLNEVDRLPPHTRIDKANLARIVYSLFEEMASNVNAHLEDHEEQWKIDNITSGDPIEQRLSELFESRLGEPYDEQQLQRIYRDGRERYKDKIPPGFSDDKDKPEPDKFGDLVIWHQIMDFGQAQSVPIVLVTDDQKEDWVRRIDDETPEPRPELIEEFREHTGHQFWLYNSESFLVHAGNKLDKFPLPGTVEEVREVAAQQAAQAENHRRALRGVLALERLAKEAGFEPGEFEDTLRRQWARWRLFRKASDARIRIPGSDADVPIEDVVDAWARIRFVSDEFLTDQLLEALVPQEDTHDQEDSDGGPDYGRGKQA